MEPRSARTCPSWMAAELAVTAIEPRLASTEPNRIAPVVAFTVRAAAPPTGSEPVATRP